MIFPILLFILFTSLRRKSRSTMQVVTINTAITAVVPVGNENNLILCKKGTSPTVHEFLS